MIYGCSSLQQVTMMATVINAQNCMSNWLTNTAESGTFCKNKQAKWENKDVIPDNWNVEENEVE